MSDQLGLGVIIGMAAGLSMAWPVIYVYRWARYRWGPCICEDGRVCVGDREEWEWAACPFCRTGARLSGGQR